MLPRVGQSHTATIVGHVATLKDVGANRTFRRLKSKTSPAATPPSASTTAGQITETMHGRGSATRRQPIAIDDDDDED
jgi:hypothetical protein